MPTVITYWQLPQDEEEFLDFLDTTGDVVALPSWWVRDRAELAPQPIREFLATHDQQSFSFGLKNQLRDMQIKPREFNGESGFMYPSITENCLIGYDRPLFRNGNKLTQSNLAAYWTYLDNSESTVVDKDPEFLSWGKQVFSWVRKQTPHWHEYKSYRVTNRAIDAMKVGEIELVT